MNHGVLGFGSAVIRTLTQVARSIGWYLNACSISMKMAIIISTTREIKVPTDAWQLLKITNKVIICKISTSTVYSMPVKLVRRIGVTLGGEITNLPQTRNKR